MRVIFMGTPDFSVPVLASLIEAGHDIAAVYCQPPRPAGRGKKDRPSPVQAYAELHGLVVRYPINFKDHVDVAAFADFKADIAVVVAYGLILPSSVLDAPTLGCINIHASLLPRWRGAAPIHRSIMAGDTQTGVCIMQMEAGLDTGPVLLREATPINSADTTLILHDRLSAMGAALCILALDDFAALTPVVQSPDGVTYATKINKSEAAIDWSKSAREVDLHIRGLSPFPGAWTLIDGERTKILMSEVAKGTGAPATALNDTLTIACGSDAITLLRLQRAGKSAMTPDDFLRGYPVLAGQSLGT